MSDTANVLRKLPDLAILATNNIYFNIKDLGYFEDRVDMTTYGSGHVVNIGNASGYENKFAKLKLFYSEVMPKRGWNTFDTISVKWNHQIVATRRSKAVAQVVQYDPEDDEQAPDIETMTVGAADDAKKAPQGEAAKKQDEPKKQEKPTN